MNTTYTAISNRSSHFMPYEQPSTSQHVLLPQCSLSEQAILQLLLNNPADTSVIVNKNKITHELLNEPRHKVIFRELQLGISMGTPHDLITLTEKLWPILDTLGGASYISEIATGYAIQSNINEYIRQIKRTSTHREVIDIASTITREATGTTVELEEVLNKLKTRSGGLSLEPVESTRPSFTSSIASALLHIQNGSESLADIQSGIAGLDEIVKMRKGNLIVIGGPAKGGKTSLAMTMLLNAVNGGKRAIFHSLEMSPTEIAVRLLSMESKVPTSGLSQENITTSQLDALSLAACKLSANESNLEIVSDLFELEEIVAHIKTRNAETPLDLVVVDYVQLVETLSKDKQGNRQEAVASVSRGLKRLAAELDIVVIALSQLNDNGELRESRALGMDANVVIKVVVDKTTFNRSVLVEMQRSGPSNQIIDCEYVPDLTLFRTGTFSIITPASAPSPQASNFMRNLMGLPPAEYPAIPAGFAAPQAPVVAPVTGEVTSEVTGEVVTREELDQLHSQLFDDEETYADEAHFSQEEEEDAL